MLPAAEVSSSKRVTLWSLLAAASILFLVVLSVFWVGFLGSDDATYWEGSTGWLHHFPYLAANHWALRHTLVIPIAAARLILGDSPVSLFLPTIFYALGVIAIVGIWTWRAASIPAAIAALLFIVSTPQIAIYSSTAAVDIVELFFVLCAFFLLASVMAGVGNAGSTNPSVDASSRRRLLLTGGFLGLGLISRETAAFAIITVALLCFVQYKLERKYYLLIFAGLAAVIGIEFVYLWVESGQPFYRYAIDVHHDSNINRWVDQGAAVPFVHPAIDPFTMLLLNHNFGLTSWVAVPLSVYLARRRDLSDRKRTLVVLLGTLALVWTGLAAGLWMKLTLIPRYYLLPSVCILVLAGLALGQMWQEGRRWMPGVLGALLVISNLAALSLDNRNVMFGEYTLAKLAAQWNTPIHTDPQTARRVELLLDWADVRRKQVTAAPLHKGDLVFVNPLHPHAEFEPAEDWKLIYEKRVPQSGGHMLSCSLPTSIVPQSMRSSVRCGGDSLRLYRVGTIRKD